MTRTSSPARGLRRLTSLTAASAVVLGLLTALPVAQAAAADPLPPLLVGYDFPGTSGGSGTTVPDVSGNNRNGTITGSGAGVGGGVLSLPGGSSGSGAAHVVIPAGTFDGKNTVTISTWLRNQTTAGNQTAVYFGTTQSLPTGYWLLNPRSPGNTYKSVYTNSLSTTQPWTTEVGSSSAAATDDWALYTTVISPTSISVYLNETRIETVAKTRNVSDFGTNLASYIGRSSYADRFWQGQVRDFKVYDGALDDAQVAERFWTTADTATVDAALAQAAAAIDLGGSVVTGDLILPTVGARGAEIAWSSSDPEIIATDGTVTRPTDADAEVTLTATLTLGGRTTTRDFVLTVPKDDAQADLERTATAYVIPPTVVSGTDLPELGGGVVTTLETSTAGLSISGRTVTVSGSEPVENAEITATLAEGAVSTSKTFTVTALPAAAADYVLGYERTPLATQTYSSNLAYSLHLGLGDTTSAFTALNSNYGVLFAKAAPTAEVDLLQIRTLRNPWIFATADGGYGVVATRAMSNGTRDAAAANSVLLFTSPDLQRFTEVGLLDLGTAGGVTVPRMVWDSAAGSYLLTWTSDGGTAYRATVSELSATATVGSPAAGAATIGAPAVSTTITGAVPTTLLPVTATVGTDLLNRFGRVVNTTIDVPDVSLETGEDLDLSGVAADLGYSDGSAKSLPIDWNADDLATVDTAVSGDYTVRGTVRQRTYPAPFVNAEADPDIVFYNGKYLFISTDDTNVIGATRMYLRQADTIDGLRTAPDHEVARTGVAGINGCFWAPELHVIGGKLSVLFAPCIGAASWNRVQAHITQLTGTDPTITANWSTPAPVLQADGSPLQKDSAHPGISLDMTYFEDAGTHYVAWSQRYITGVTGDAEIWVATIDPADPIRLTSTPTKLVTSEYGWDMNTSNVAEGPYVLRDGDTIHLSYSGSNVDATYTVGLLSATSGDDLTDQGNWTKENTPALFTDQTINQWGPGHNAFVTDEDGNPVLVYHAKQGGNSGYRHTFLRRVHLAADGRPVLDMKADEEVLPANRPVTITVSVTGESATAPATPARPSATLADGDLTATWTAPANGGSPILDYTVTLSTVGGTEVDSATVTGLTHTFTDLADGDYVVGVTARNAVGSSAQSQLSPTVVVGQRVLAHYALTDLTAATAGTQVPDSSGNDHHGELLGSGATVSGTDGLHLPGGANGSGAAHVKLPTGLFDGRTTLTVSAWIKNETGAGNYAAAFFGSAANPPRSYWLLNPADPSGRFKTVMTGADSSSPWNTEYGISPTVAAQGVPGPVSSTDWALYTTVITPTSITGYYNGISAGTVSVPVDVASYGSNLVAYLGRSSYPDKFFAGGIRDVTVYTTAQTAAQVADDFYRGLADDALTDAALAADADAVTLPARTATDLDLPRTGGNGSTISWATDDADHLTARGVVDRPAETDAEVTLTATFSLAGRTLTRTYPVTVLAATVANDLLVAADEFDLGITVTAADVVLRTDAGNGVSIAWASSDPAALSPAGVVTRAGTDRTVTLTATFAKDGETRTATYQVRVLAADTGRAGSYIRTGNTVKTDVLHLAVSTNPAPGGSYTAVNNGRGVLFPGTGTDPRFGTPTIFRHPDGTFGLVATVNSASSSIYVYDSADLTAFTGERLVSFVTGHTAAAVDIAYDNGILGYRLRFTSLTDGVRYEVVTKDLVTFSAPVPTTAPAVASDGTFPSGALETRSLGLTAAEAERLTTKLGRVVQTGVQPLDDITVAQGGTLTLPDTGTATYNSGSTAAFGIDWDAGDLAAVDLSTPGSYQVSGTLRPQTYTNPLVQQRADPDVTLGDDGWYYFTGSYPTMYGGDPEGYDRIVLRRARTIDELSTATEVVLWDEAQSATLNRYIWAPELEKIGDDWYILFTAARGGGVWDIRPAMLKLTGTDLMNPAHWTELGQVKAKPGDGAFTSFSLDMTHFEQGGRHYLAWAQTGSGGSELRLAEIDPADPTQLISNQMVLAVPTLAWERNGSQAIDEGPAVIKNAGKIWVAFSASTVDENYTVGLLSADEDADLLDPASWTKTGYPVLGTADLVDQRGPGHNSFTTDEYGNPVIVYHARTPSEIIDGGLNDPGRHARAKTVLFDVDGQPYFAATADEELDPALAGITVTVIVQGPSGPTFSDVSESSPFYTEIEWAAANGIVSGFADGTFRPGLSINRDAVAAMLFRAENPGADKPVCAPGESPFTDVPSSHQFCGEIAWMKAEGISTGNADGTYSPSDPVSRQAIAAFLARAWASGPLPVCDSSLFVDVPVNNPFCREITWMKQEGITNGWSTPAGAQFRPIASIERQAFVAFLYRHAAD